MWLGIDFGTTNTSAAIWDHNQPKFIPLDPKNASANNLRSMIYIDNHDRASVGVDAVQRFLTDDSGRPVLLEDKVVGTIENTVARQERGLSDADEAITIVYDVLISEDVGIRGRLLQSIKTALRSPAYTGTKIFGKFYTVEELIALILGHVKGKAEAYLHQPIQQAVIGRPVTFSHNAETDRLAEQKIRHAAKLIGINECLFVPEPVAAAHYYAQAAQRDETILVFDFGGGTLDLTMLRIRETGEREILASTGILLGGDDLDTAIMRGKVAPHFGAKSPIDTNFDGRPIPFPEHLADLLDQWQTIPTLTRPQNLAVIQRGIQYGDNHHAFEALATLATQNYGFALFQAIERAKCELSEGMHTHVEVRMGETKFDIGMSRNEFNRMISQERAQVREGIRETITASGIKADQIHTIVATGGSSSIPIFHTLLKAELPNAKLILSDRFGSVTGGLALYAHMST